MKVLLLAAGRSKRMKPIEDKNFLSFLGKPLITHQIDKLIEAGFGDIIVVGGKHNMKNLKELPELYGKSANFQFVEQENLDEGMAGAVLSSEDFIDESALCIVSANDVVDTEAYLLVKKSFNENYDTLIVGKKVESYFPGGYLETDKEGVIKGIVEKPGAGNEPSDLVNIVIHCHKNPKNLLKAIKNTSSNNDDRYEVAIDTLIKQGEKMKAVEFDGCWQPLKYPWHVFDVMDYFFKTIEGRISEKADIAKTAVIKNRDKVIIEEGAKIFDHAVIKGPCFIGKNTVIANNSLVRDSMVNEASVIGYSTEIARSYIGQNVWTHSNYIGDSVISNNCAFGSGTVTGNLRLDEEEIKLNVGEEKLCTGKNKFGIITGENVRCGINTSFMPGIKIGRDSMIGAGIAVSSDIPDFSFVKSKTEVEIRKNKSKINPDGRKEMLERL